MKQIIKYAALLFALILASSIIGGCLSAGVTVIQKIAERTGNTVTENGGNDWWYRNEEGNVVFLGLHFGSSGDVKSGTEQFASGAINSMDIDVGSGKLVIEAWDNDYVSVDYENIPAEYKIFEENGTLRIKKTDSINIYWNMSFVEKEKIHVYAPASLVFEKVDVDSGSGGLEIANVTAKQLNVDSGSGGTTISGLSAEKSAFNSGSGSFTVQDCELGDTSMDGGSGFITFENVQAKNLVLDTGSGRTNFSGTLTGNCVFESGSGSVNVVIYGKEEDYNIRVNMGSGSFYLNGEKEKKEHIEHSGADHLLVFDAGSGRVSVDFQNSPAGLSENGGNYDR